MSEFDFDHAYLREAVGAPLTEAMAQLAILQPEDPVEFLGRFLLKHVANERERREREKQQQQQQHPPSPFLGLASRGAYGQSQQLHDSDAEREQLVALEGLLPGELQSARTAPELYERFARWLAGALQADEAYVGRRGVDPAGQALVHWVASSRGPRSVTIGRFVTEGTGVTFDVFKEVEGEGVDAEGNPVAPAVPRFVHVENVLREPRVKFFHVPKLGAYVTRGLAFRSYLHPEVFNDANPEEPTLVDDWVVVSADTMGQARAFSAEELASFQRATQVFVHALEELERDLFLRDRDRRAGGEDALLKEFAVAFAAQVAVQEENLLLQVQDLPEDDKALKEAELRAAYLTLLLQSHVPTLALAAARVVPFRAPVLGALAAALELLGHPHAELFNPATKVPTWERLAPLLREDALQAALGGFQVPTPPPAPALAAAKRLLGDTTKADVDGASPIAGCLYAWTQAVVAHADQAELAAERARALQEQPVTEADE